MQDDETQVRRGDTPEAERHFETPRLVREIHPESRQPPAQSEAARPSPSSSVEPPPPPSKVDPSTGERPQPSELTATFQRRWEEVQAVFVARGSRGARRIGGHPQPAAR